MSAPQNGWICPFCGEQIAAGRNDCPACRAVIQNSNAAPQPAQRYIVEPAFPGRRSAAAGLLKALAFCLWIGGLIVAYFSSAGSSSGSINWSTFLSIMIACLLYGIICFCLAELFENLQKIANSLQQLSVTPASAPAPAKRAPQVINPNTPTRRRLNEHLPWFIHIK